MKKTTSEAKAKTQVAKPKTAKRLKLSKQTVSDLSPKGARAAAVKGASFTAFTANHNKNLQP
jgi:hypothetical protein